MIARATARVARTIHGDVEHGQLGIVRATLAVAPWHTLACPGSPIVFPAVKMIEASLASGRPGSPIVFLAIIHSPRGWHTGAWGWGLAVQSSSQQSFTNPVQRHEQA